MASADYSLRRSVSTGMLNGSLNIVHMRKYPPWYLKNRCRFLCQSLGQKEEHCTIPDRKNNRILAGERV
jgi:hypothetical protein